MNLARKVLVFFALFHKLKHVVAEDICYECIQILGGVDDNLIGNYRFKFKFLPVFILSLKVDT